MKKIFDEIFETKKYTDALDDLRKLGKDYWKNMKGYKHEMELLQKDFDQYRWKKKELSDIEAEVAKIESIINEARSEVKDKETRVLELEEEEKWLRTIEVKVGYANLNLTSKEKDLKQVLSVLGVQHLSDLKNDISSNDEKLKEAERIDGMIQEKKWKIDENKESLERLWIEKSRMQGIYNSKREIQAQVSKDFSNALHSLL